MPTGSRSSTPTAGAPSDLLDRFFSGAVADDVGALAGAVIRR